jgi:hypothetical protein
MKLRCTFNELMRKCHRQGVMLDGSAAGNHEEYFGFTCRDVVKVHLHKQGVGTGVWFRLRCGRVVDEVARACRRDPALYDRAVA